MPPLPGEFSRDIVEAIKNIQSLNHPWADPELRRIMTEKYLLDLEAMLGRFVDSRIAATQVHE